MADAAAGSAPAVPAPLVGGSSASTDVAPTGQKRKSPDEGDAEMLEMHQLFDPDEEADSFMLSLHEDYIRSIQEQVDRGAKKPVCEIKDPYADFDPDWWTAYDDVNGGPLDPVKVKDARMKEIEVINEVGVLGDYPKKPSAQKHESYLGALGRHQQR